MLPTLSPSVSVAASGIHYTPTSLQMDRGTTTTATTFNMIILYSVVQEQSPLTSFLQEILNVDGSTLQDLNLTILGGTFLLNLVTFTSMRGWRDENITYNTHMVRVRASARKKVEHI
jgi:hypothetical protein